MKYEYTITGKKHGQNKMRRGAILSILTISFYIFLTLKHPGFDWDLINIIVFLVILSFGVLEYTEGNKLKKQNKGLWTFNVNKNGVYLSTPDGLTRHVELNKISAFEEICIDEGDSDLNYYILVQQDKINFDLCLPINIDFPKIKEVLGHYGVTILDLSYKGKKAYNYDLKLKGRVHKKFNEGFEF